MRPHGDPGGLLVAVVENAETGEELARRPLKPAADDGEWLSAELDPLPEGVYRISSIGGSIEPVTDLVTVVAE